MWPRQDQNRGTQRARTVDTAGSEQGYTLTVDKNCWQEIIRTGVHSGQEMIRTGVNSGQELWAWQDQNRGKQWARIVSKT